MKAEKKVRIAPYISKSLKAKLLVFCARKGISYSDYVEALLSKSLKRN